jgi:hypothetical protein
MESNSKAKVAIKDEECNSSRDEKTSRIFTTGEENQVVMKRKYISGLLKEGSERVYEYRVQTRWGVH